MIHIEVMFLYLKMITMFSYPPPNLRELSLWQLFLGLLVVLISVFWLPALPFLVSPLLLMASSPPPFPEVDCFLSTPSVRYRYTTRAGNLRMRTCLVFHFSFFSPFIFILTQYPELRSKSFRNKFPFLSLYDTN